MLNSKTNTDHDITKLILVKFTECNLEDILIYSDGQPFLEEVKSLTKKVFIVKNEIKGWYSESHQPIRDSPDRNLSNLILGKLNTITIDNVEFLNLSDQELIDQKQYDLEMLISLFSNLLTLHYYTFEWLKYLSSKYHAPQDENEVNIEWE